MDSVDFLPERIRAQRAKRQRIVRQGYLLAVCTGALVLLACVRQERISEARAELAILTGRAANTRQQLLLRGSLERQQAELMIMKRIEQDLGSRVNVLDVLSELETLMPESIALMNLTLETKEVRIPIKVTNTKQTVRIAFGRPLKKERVIRRIRLTLEGISPTDVDIANLIGQISASRLFEDVNMGYARNVVCRDRQAREFKASSYIVR